MDCIDRLVPQQTQTKRLGIGYGDSQRRGDLRGELPDADRDLLDETYFAAAAEDHRGEPVPHVDEDDRSFPVLLAAHRALERSEQRTRRRINGDRREPGLLEHSNVVCNGLAVGGEKDVFVFDDILLADGAGMDVVDRIFLRVQAETLGRFFPQDLVGLRHLGFRQPNRSDPKFVDGKRGNDLPAPELAVRQQMTQGLNHGPFPILAVDGRVRIQRNSPGRQHFDADLR